MCKSTCTGGYCPQNKAVSLVCPLDIQGRDEFSMFGDVLKHNEQQTNLGLINVSWKWNLKGSSLLLGMIIGVVITVIIILIIKHIKHRKLMGRW